MRYLSRLELLGGLIVGVGLVSACSLVYDLSDDQCEINADCDALGGDFRGRECRAGVCVPTGNQSGGNGGGGAGGSGGCTSTRECLESPDRLGLTACIDGACVQLTNDTTCPVVLPSDEQKLEEQLLSGGEPIILGAFAPLFPPQLESPVSHNYDLAFTEFNNEAGGVPAPGSSRRALVAVVCQTPVGTPIEELHTSLDHLIGNLKVPGIVATMFPEDLSVAFEYKRTNTQADPFWLSTLESDSTLITTADSGLLWHILPSGEDMGLPVKPLLTRVLESKELEEPARVALLVDRDNRGCVDLSTTILDQRDGHGIEFNGDTALDQDESTFRSFSTHTADTPSVLSGVVQELLEFQPHVIIAMTGKEFFAQIFDPLENQWNDATSQAPRPFYILSPYQANTSEVSRVLAKFKTRMAGINAAASKDRSVIKAYLDRYKSEFPAELSHDQYENYYDAPYFLMYAAAAAVPNTARLRGQDLADGMKKLIDIGAPQYRIGIDKIGAALQALTNGSIQLDGTLGPPEFNRDTGARTTLGSVWCAGKTSTQPEVADALRYTESGELELGVDENGDPLEELPCAATF
jgi:hypothetical protein